MGEGPSEKVCGRRSIGKGSREKGCRRRFAREGPSKKVRQRGSARTGPPEKGGGRRAVGKVALIPCEEKNNSLIFIN